jgi:hypothetical protein
MVRDFNEMIYAKLIILEKKKNNLMKNESNPNILI